MAKSADLRDAMLSGAGKCVEKQAPAADVAPGDRGPHYRPSREGKSNVTGYFNPAVKRQLRILAAERDTTIQALLGEALNDLFAKYGRPEVV